MPKLIDLNGELLANEWARLDKDAELADATSNEAAKLIVPLQLWLNQKQELQESGKIIAVWLDAEENVNDLEHDLSHLSLIALNFPKFVDGRAYSKASNLRKHFDYKGEIRAIGDVLRDQLFYMRRCGFSTFDLAECVKLDDAKAAMQDFRDNYQSTIEEPTPLFRRRLSA